MRRTLLVISVILALLNLYGCKSLYFQYLVKVAPDRFEFEEEHKNLSIPVYSSQPLENMNNTVEYLIVMIHGGALNARNAFNNGQQIFESLKIPKNKSMVVAPQFLEKGADQDERGLLFWDRKWREGGISLSAGVNKGLPEVSSYDVLDRLIEDIIKYNPNLRRIAILGHSAGGQFVVRYAAINNCHNILGEQGLPIRYVVANPSSYLYLDGTRYQFDSDGTIVHAPYGELLACPDYNKYKYGLENLCGYAETLSPQLIRSRLLTRQIMFILGKTDTERNWGLNKSCQGDAQGKNRYERGLLYKHHLEHYINKSALTSPHVWLEIPDVGHNSTKIFSHPYFIEKLKELDF